MLLNKISEKLAYHFFDKNATFPKEVYVYGMSLILSSSVTSILLCVAGVMIGRIVETVIFILTFSALRIFTGGFHSKSYILCNVYTVLMYLLIIKIYYVLFHYLGNPIIYVPLFVLSFALIFLFAPIQHKNKSLTDNQHNSIKVKSRISLCLEMIIFLVLYYAGWSKILVMLPTIFMNDILMFISLLINRKGGNRCGKAQKNN